MILVLEISVQVRFKYFRSSLMIELRLSSVIDKNMKNERSKQIRVQILGVISRDRL